MFRLRISVDGKDRGVVPLKEGPNGVGRSRSSDVRLDADDVSRSHLNLVLKDGVLTAENVGPSVSSVDGRTLKSPVELKSGQRIMIGAHTTLVVEGDASAAPTTLGGGSAAPSPGGEPTRTGSAATEVPRAPTGGVRSTQEDDEIRTRAMQTRVAAPDEMEYLRAAEQKRIRLRMGVVAGSVVLLLVLAVVFRPKPEAPENVIAWSQDAQGAFLDMVGAAPSGGSEVGGYDLVLPDDPDAKKTSIERGYMIESHIGRHRDVQFRFTVQEEEDRRFLTMSRMDMVQDWMDRTRRGPERWNFGKPSASVQFLGKENGVPFVSVSYEREQKGVWFGVATLFRHGLKQVVVRAEVPRSERVRAEDIVYSVFPDVSVAFERTYWEPVQEVPQTPVDDLLRRVNREMQRVAPATWGEISTQLRGIMTKAQQEQRPDAINEARDALVRLRERQALWFNSQRLAREAAEAQGDEALAGRITEFTKAVFSDVEDQRYYSVRKWETGAD